MTIAYKVLGQVNPAATTSTTLYTCPALTSAVASTLAICNQGSTTTVRAAIRQAGASLDPKQYIVYDAIVNANDTLFLTIGVSLETTDIVAVYAGTANVAFNLFGSEIT
jgi:hypothetical protein